MAISTISITMFYGGLLGIWFLVLTARVLQGRAGKGKPSLGDGGDIGMQRRIRAHGNFSEYVPLTLILIALLEFNGTSAWLIHILGLSLLIGRLLHGYAFAFTPEHVFGRSAGILLSLISLALGSILTTVQGIGGV